MFLMCTMSSFAIYHQGPLAKFDVILMLLIGSLCSTPCLPLTLPSLSIRKWLTVRNVC